MPFDSRLNVLKMLDDLRKMFLGQNCLLRWGWVFQCKVAMGHPWEESGSGLRYVTIAVFQRWCFKEQEDGTPRSPSSAAPSVPLWSSSWSKLVSVSIHTSYITMQHVSIILLSKFIDPNLCWNAKEGFPEWQTATFLAISFTHSLLSSGIQTL